MTIDDDIAGAEDSSGLLAALPTILWQRRWLLIVPLVLATIAGCIAAFVMKPVYESTATVLIESAQLGDVSSSPVTDVIDERIARTRERVLTRMDLIRLIRANDLYPKEQRTTPLSKIVDKMRDATVLDVVNADIRSGRSSGPSTIAMNIGFRYDDPVKAQSIAQQYVNRFLELDASSQSEQATGAANFLSDQANDLQAQIASVEGKINAIKSKNGAVLALSEQSTGDPTADAARIDAEIAGLQAQNAQLAGAPVAADPNSGVGAAEAALRMAEARYSDTHPDVIAAKAQLAAARRDAGNVKAYNPASAQIAANRTQMAALQNAKGMIISRSSTMSAAAARGPALAAQVDQLEKQADALRDQYRTIATRLQGAQVSARMQSEQKGERLSLADPPVVPDHPSKPNRPVIIIGAIIAGGAIGMGLILLVELLMRPIRGTAAVKAATGEAPLVVIPDFAHKPGMIMRMIEARHRRKLARS